MLKTSTPSPPFLSLPSLRLFPSTGVSPSSPVGLGPGFPPFSAHHLASASHHHPHLAAPIPLHHPHARPSAAHHAHAGQPAWRQHQQRLERRQQRQWRQQRQQRDAAAFQQRAASGSSFAGGQNAPDGGTSRPRRRRLSRAHPHPITLTTGVTTLHFRRHHSQPQPQPPQQQQRSHNAGSPPDESGFWPSRPSRHCGRSSHPLAP